MDREHQLREWLRWTLIALFVVFAMLVGTGVWLILNYQPPLTGPPLDDQTLWTMQWVSRVRTVHRTSGWLMVILGVVLFLEAAVDAVWRRRIRIALPAIPVPAVTVVALLSGFLVRWIDVTLSSGRTTTDEQGFGVLFGGRARSFTVDGAPMSVDEIQRWFWTHTTVVPVVLLVLLAVTTVLVARTRPALASPAGTDVDVTGS